MRLTAACYLRVAVEHLELMTPAFLIVRKQATMREKELQQFCSDWANAWTTKDIDVVMSFFCEDAEYRDPYHRDGLVGMAAIGQYFEKLITENAGWQWQQETSWPLDGGFALKWQITELQGTEHRVVEHGISTVYLKDGKICRYSVVLDQHMHLLAS